MTLSSGRRFGVYEISGLLGSGGMGDVYRARDTRLGRDIALKVLPPAFTHDAERVARFQREAQLLGSLNHPNIAAIYAVEETQTASGPPEIALVLELVEGPTLAERLARGALPLDEALPLARQIADALEAAHERGIVHRDLKPANIKISPEGRLKVLDFGLAKAIERSGESGGSGGAAGVYRPDSLDRPDLSASPTITSPAMLTGAGMILGTAAYMSPEQAKGQEAGRAADLWAFGCVLYEMLTGAAVFHGASVSEILSEVLKSEPDWTRLPSETPESVRRSRTSLPRERSAAASPTPG